MKLDPNNDVYPGDLGILNARKHKWAKGTKKGYGFKIASYGILAAGLFEVSDDTVYYVYQQGMKLKTYYIRDAQIKKIIRDDEAGVLCIEGKATLNTQTRDSETEENLDKFYALVPFDKYELDDLLAPYKKKVVKSDGKLRESFN